MQLEYFLAVWPFQIGNSLIFFLQGIHEFLLDFDLCIEVIPLFLQFFHISALQLVDALCNLSHRFGGGFCGFIYLIKGLSSGFGKRFKILGHRADLFCQLTIIDFGIKPNRSI